MNYTRGAMLRGCAGILLLSSALACAQAAAPAVIGGRWTELGPKPVTDPQYGAIAGRITAIAVDRGKDPSGNTIYLGAADGGLWMSTNALSANPTFTPIDGSLPTLAIGAIALDDSTTPTTIYVGTGEPNGSQDSFYGLGIYKSTDGGQTWTAGTDTIGLQSQYLGTAVGRLLVDPKAPNVLLAAMARSGFYIHNNYGTTGPAEGVLRSTDGGVTWSDPIIGPPTDLVYDPASGDDYAATDGILQSTDQGQTWQTLPSPFGPDVQPNKQNFARVSLAVRDGVIYALIADASGDPTSPLDCSDAPTCAGLVYSSDNGATWHPLSLPPNLYGSGHLGKYDQVIAAPAGSSLLLVGGVDLWDEDLSATTGWTNLTNSTQGKVHGGQHAVSVLGPKTWIIANDGGAWSTTDGGASWTNMNASIAAVPFRSVAADPATAGRLLGGIRDNGTALAASGRPDWPLIVRGSGDGGYTAINPQNPQQLFAEGAGVSVECSSDGGASFSPVVDTTTIADITSRHVPYVLAPSDPATMYLAGSRVWRGPACPSVAGAGWQAISPDLTQPRYLFTGLQDALTALAVAPSSPGVIYAGAYDGTVSSSTNATATGGVPAWAVSPASVKTTEVYAGPVTAIAVSPTDPKTVYWGNSSIGFGAHLYMSTDGGATATKIAGNLPDTPVTAILISPTDPGVIYLATGAGVFAANDGGAGGANEIWTQIGENLPATEVTSLALTSAGGTPTLIAGTAGRGAWSLPAVAPPSFSMTLTPDSQSVDAGQTATYTLQTAAAGGPSTIALSCGGQFVTCQAAPAAVAAGGSATISVEAQSAVLPIPVVVTGDNSYVSLTASARFSAFNFAVTTNQPVNANGPVPVQMGGSYSLTFNVAAQGPQPFDAPIRFACPNAPAGISCTFSPASIPSLSGSASETMTVQVAAAAQPSVVTLQMQATGGAISQSLDIKLQINAFGLSVTPATLTAPAGAPAQFQVAATSLSSFAGSIALTCTVPFGTANSCTLQPASILPGQTSTVTVAGLQLSQLPYTVDISGVSGLSLDQAQATLQESGFSFTTSTAVTIPGSSQITGTVTVIPTFGFSAPITLGCNAGAGLQCSFSPAVVTPPGSDTASFTVTGLAGEAASNAIPLTIVGTGGGLQETYPTTLANDGGIKILSITPQLAGILPGDPVTFGVSAFPSNGFSGPVTLHCGPLPGAAACSIANGNVTVSGVTSLGSVPVPIVATVSDGGATASAAASARLQVSDFTLTPTAPNFTLSRGGSATIALNVAAPGVNTGPPAAVVCSGLPAGVTCAYSPQRIDDNSQLLVQVQAAPSVAASPGAGWPWGGGALLLALGMVWAGRRRRWRLVAAGAAALACASCGGGGGGSSGGSGANGVAPLVTSVTITVADATPGVGNPDTVTVTVPLTVN